MQYQPQSTYRLKHLASGLSIRLHCEPTPSGELPRIAHRLTGAENASCFAAADAARAAAKAYLPKVPVEIVPVNA